VDALLTRLEQPYPFANATKQAAKSSVSTLRHEAEDEDAQPLFFLRVTKVRAPQPGELSALDIGTAHHRFQQFVSLTAVGTVEELRAEAARLVATGGLEPTQTAALRFEQLYAFWNSTEGRLIRQHSRSVRRELEFTARFTPRELAALGLGSGDADSDFIVIQGVADLVVFLPDELWLLDFKTDHLQPGELDERARYHAPQLALYAQALEGIYSRRVTRQWLHFFGVERTVDVLFLANLGEKS